MAGGVVGRPAQGSRWWWGRGGGAAVAAVAARRRRRGGGGGWVVSAAWGWGWSVGRMALSLRAFRPPAPTQATPHKPQLPPPAADRLRRKSDCPACGGGRLPTFGGQSAVGRARSGSRWCRRCGPR
nr:hypothetical protein GCM10017745_76060 [Saccharothrix mutabilis subsp. capreolus]